jgi:hypothetical protein
MERNALRNSAAHRHGKYIRVSVVFTGKSDGISVGRKGRIGFKALAGGEPLGRAALARHAPEIACVGENDEVFAHRRPLQQMHAGRLRGGERGRTSE